MQHGVPRRQQKKKQEEITLDDWDSIADAG
jgi:hypothetical protein